MHVTQCPYLVEVASGNPEPDSPADLVEIVECGAAIVATAHDGQSLLCEHGHELVSYVASEGGAIPPEWIDIPAQCSCFELGATGLYQTHALCRADHEGSSR